MSSELIKWKVKREKLKGKRKKWKIKNRSTLIREVQNKIFNVKKK
jgi:hypothetical protein